MAPIAAGVVIAGPLRKTGKDDMQYLEPTMLFGVLILASCVGFLTGVFGVGGGFLVAPALMIFLDVPAPIAIGTSLTMILGVSSYGLWRRRGTDTIDWKLAMIIAAGSLIGVIVGVWLLERIKAFGPLTIAGRQVDDVTEYVVMWVFLVLLLGIAAFMTFDYVRTRGRRPAKRVGLFARAKLSPLLHFDSLEEHKLSAHPLVLLGVTTGVLTGFLGVGGGVIFLPALVYLVGQRAAKAAGTSLMITWLSTMVGAIKHAQAGHVAPMLLVEMFLGGLVGTFGGIRVGLKLDGPRIRLYFLFIVAAAIVLVAWKLHTETFGGQPGR